MMNSSLRLLSSALVVLLTLQVPTQSQDAQPRSTELVELSVNGIARAAHVYVPHSAKTVPTPVVFAFHGHNGNAAAAAQDYAMHREWPEAITVYMQGLNTPGRFIDPEGKETGWQMQPGHQGDRDLEFFDAMLAHLKEDYRVDEERIYAFGHSGGGYFVYLLWAMRGNVLAGVAPMSSEAAENLPMLKPMPVLLLAGRKDGAVKYEWVRKTMDAVRELNGCSAEGRFWDEHCTLFPSATGTPLVEFVHPGGHEVPREAIASIARFFKVHHEKNGRQTSGNPVFDGWYADPEGIVFGDTYWIYPTYSAPYDKQVFFDCFSSKDLVTWEKHARILSTDDIKWARRAMWAPSTIEKDGKYYFFFGANDIQNDETIGGIGVAVADSPAGPYQDHLGKPLIDKFHNGAQPIDQFVFKDADGTYYLIYGGWRHCNIARLNDDFSGFIPFDDGTTFREITPDGYVEGPFMFIRGGKYYFMWSEGGWTGPDYSVAYAIADSPFGPFKRISKVLKQDAKVATGAGHHSVIHVPKSDSYYAVYHRRPLGETDRNSRVTCIDRMEFDENGFIKPIRITNEGVPAHSLDTRFNRPPLKPKPYASLRLGEVRAEGWLRTQLELMAEGMTGHLDKLYQPVVGPRNGWLGGDGDGWERGPYWIDGLLPLAYLLDDEDLIAKVMPWVEWTLRNQTDDGYLGPVPFASEPSAERGLQRGMRRDWWPKMVMLKILQNHYRATGDERVLTVLDKYFRYQLKELPKRPLGHWSFWGNRRGGDNLAVVLWLYNITAEDYLLELAELLHQQTFDHTRRWLADDSPLKRREGMHCVNIAQGLKHPIVYSQIDGQLIHMRAVKKALADLDEHFGHPTGLFGGDELLNSKRPTTGSEFCTAAEAMFSLEMMAEITGDVELLDRLERIALNVVPTQVTDDYSGKQYYSTVNQVDVARRTKRAHINDHDGTDTVFGLLSGYPCCLTNFHQAWPKFTQRLWMASRDGGLAALYFAPSKVETEVNGKLVTIVEETNYPFEDSIRFRITTDSPNKFPIHLRVPGWCKEAEIQINGKQHSQPVGGQIVQVQRRWQDGDVLTLTLPCELKASRWYKDSVSLHRGPLLFALKLGESWQAIENDGWYGDYAEVHPTTPWNYGLPANAVEDLDKHFKLVRSPAVLPSNPWSPEGAPLWIESKGHRIEQWTINDNRIAGELSHSPVKVDRLKLEPINLIPYGCTTLRIAEFPVVSTAEDALEWTSNEPRQLYQARASHCFGGDSVDAIGDSVEPSHSADNTIPRMTFWDHKGTAEWCEAEFDEPRVFDESSIYWFDDTGSGECRVPESWQLFYRENDQWVPVKTESTFGTKRDRFNNVSFEPIRTDAFRVSIQLKENFSTGILEWRIEKSSR